jgi:hypothetical protein
VFKVYMTKKFHDKPTPFPLLGSKMTEYYNAMRANKIELVNAANEAWVNPHEQATDEDNSALGATCYWTASIKAAEFYHLYRSMVNNAGRGSEISSLHWSNAFPTTVTDNDGSRFKTLLLYVKRLKTQNISPRPDEIVHFVHRDTLLDDYTFSMFYHLVLTASDANSSADSESDDCMFPSWISYVSNKDGSRTDSTVSNAFREHWKWLYSVARKYVGGLPEDADEAYDEFIQEFSLHAMKESESIHCGKKRGLQLMGDSFLTPQVSCNSRGGRIAYY